MLADQQRLTFMNSLQTLDTVLRTYKRAMVDRDDYKWGKENLWCQYDERIMIMMM